MRHRKRIVLAMRDTNPHKRHVVHQRNRIPNSLWPYNEQTRMQRKRGLLAGAAVACEEQ